MNLLNLFEKSVLNENVANNFQNIIYDWWYNRGYIDIFYDIYIFNYKYNKISQFNYFFYKRIIDGISIGIGITCFFYEVKSTKNKVKSTKKKDRKSHIVYGFILARPYL